LSILFFTLSSFIHSDDEEELPTLDVAARTSSSRTLVVSETPAEGEKSSPPLLNVDAPTPPSSPLVPSPKRTRVETIVEPTLELGSSSNSLLDDVSSEFSHLCSLLIPSAMSLFFPVPSFSFFDFL
jgi:hypothetical protein